jgi:PKD repeat protein
MPARHHRRHTSRSLRAPLHGVRQLERRRLLDAAITNLLAPVVPDPVEGDTVAVSVEATGIGPLEFDWVVLRDASIVATGTTQSFSFVAVDDGNYTAIVQVTDTFDQTFDIRGTTFAVANTPPAIDSVQISPAPEGSPTTLTGKVFDAGELDTYTVAIDWGDGSPLEAVSLTQGPDSATYAADHIYADNGNYTIRILATDNSGAVGEFARTISVANVAPTATIVGNQSVAEGELLSIAGLATISDPGFDNPVLGTVESFDYSIDWGDGSITKGTATIDMLGGPGVPTTAFVDAAHIYADNGTYVVTVIVADDDGGEAPAQTFEVSVGNVAPTLSVVGNQSVAEGELLSIANIGSIVDPGFDNPLLGTTETFGYTIDWGDGTPLEAGTASIVGVGGPGVPTMATFDGAHTYADNGVYTVTITVVDDDGGESTPQTFEVTVGNVAPTVTVVGNQTVDEGQPLSIANLATIADPGFDNPVLGTTETFSYSIDWGDGTPLEAGTASIVGVGSPGVPTMATIDGTHIYADNGVYTVTVTVVDDDGGASAPQTFEVVVGNVAPTVTATASQTIDEGQTLSLANIAEITDPGFANAALGTVETFTYSIDWGDGTAVDTGAATIVAQGDRGLPTIATFAGAHTYADNGVYTVTLTVVDDDGGIGVDTFLVTVNNVAPVLTGIDTPLVVDEGELFSLATLGVALADPGFDNPLNAGNVGNGGETVETFMGTSIDWGDGTTTTPLAIVDRVSGSPGVATTASFAHAAHAYADNGVYTVTVAFADDDGGAVMRQFTVVVDNVAPTLVLTSESFSTNEGDTLTIANLGTFADPGFDNPLNPGGATTETFSYTIDWGDGTVETGQLPATRTSGSQGVPTTGTLAASHRYLDNDADNQYTISVTLSDDDGGTVTESFVVEVLNVNPTLEPLIATDVNNQGQTTLELTFSDPGADTFEVLVDWGDQLGLPPEDRFTVVTLHAGPTPASYFFTYTYAGPPNPANPTADIVVTVKIRDDDFGTPGVVTAGESNIEQIAISQPGIEDRAVVFELPTEIATLEFPVIEQAVPEIDTVDSAPVQLAAVDVGTGGGDLSATSERYFELRVVYANGELSEPVRLKDEALDNLPALFARLPDNRYQIFLVRTENNSRRLVIDVAVRDGRLVDPGDDSDGTRDRPPTLEGLQAPAEVPVEPVAPAANLAPQRPSDQPQSAASGPSDTQTASGLAAAGLVASSLQSHRWRAQLSQALATHGERRIRRPRLPRR